MIETQIWNKIPDQPGKVEYAGQRKIGEVFKDLCEFLKAENIYPEEYFLLSHKLNEEDDFPECDVECYAQWGGNEGIYLEVILITYNRETGTKRISFATGKSLSETSAAYDRMQYIAGRIYKAFCGEKFVPLRYMILSGGKKKEITYDKLIAKLEAECASFMRMELLHKQTKLADVSRKLGMMLSILSTIKEPANYADLTADKIEELYCTENILERIFNICNRISEADNFEIADLIASVPTLLQEHSEQAVDESEPKENLYYGFTHFSRMSYKDAMPSDVKDMITFGLYVRNGGCVSEAAVRWENLSGKLCPYFRIFDDGIKAAFSTRFLAVVDKLRSMGSFTPNQMAEVLISQGFEDCSDEPLKVSHKARLVLPKETIKRYERLMNVPKDHEDLEGLPKHATIERWTVPFENTDCSMDIKICSSGYGEPLWCEAILYHDGKEGPFTEPSSELSGEWTLETDGGDFTVTVEPEDPKQEKPLGFQERIDALKEKADRIGAHFEHSLFDKDHLDCFWYDGKDYITIEYQGYCICIDVCGDVYATLVCDESINEEGFLELCHKNGAEPIYFNSEVRKILQSDHDLKMHRLAHSADFKDNNWINMVIVNNETNEPVSEPEVSDYDNLLDAVEDAFDTYIDYIDKFKEVMD